MPKLIIEITEKIVDLPEYPDKRLVGIQTAIHFELAEGEDPAEALGNSSLPELLPAIECALDIAQKFTFGDGIHSGSGHLADTEEIAIAKARAIESAPAGDFPPHLD